MIDETGGVGRRGFGGAIATFALAALAGCNESRNGPSVDSELRALGDAIASLRSTIERFSSEDWKDVVPDVKSEASDVETALANLKAAMGKA